MNKGKGQQVMKHNSFLFEFQLPDGKDPLRSAQKCCQLRIQSFCKFHCFVSTATYVMSEILFDMGIFQISVDHVGLRCIVLKNLP